MALFGLSSCGGGGGTPTPDQDASGLYKNGTASLAGGNLLLNDLRAFVHDGRVIAFSVTGHLMFDGTITNITGDEYTASVDVYENGVMTQPAVAVTGMVTSQSQITGTISGTGNANGTFTLVFDLAYDDGASIDKISSRPEDWVGEMLAVYSFLGDSLVDAMAVDDIGGGMFETSISVQDSSSTLTDSCLFVGDTIVPDVNINIYQLSFDIPGSTYNTTRCTPTGLTVDDTKKYTGFAAMLGETGSDRDILVGITDGEHSIFGLLTHPI